MINYQVVAKKMTGCDKNSIHEESRGSFLHTEMVQVLYTPGTGGVLDRSQHAPECGQKDSCWQEKSCLFPWASNERTVVVSLGRWRAWTVIADTAIPSVHPVLIP